MRTITKINGKYAVILIPEDDIDKIVCKSLANTNKDIVEVTEASKFLDDVIPIGSIVIYSNR